MGGDQAEWKREKLGWPGCGEGRAIGFECDGEPAAFPSRTDGAASQEGRQRKRPRCGSAVRCVGGEQEDLTHLLDLHMAVSSRQ